MARSRKKLGEYLIRWGIITEKQLEEALNILPTTGMRIGQALVELNYATEDDIAKALAAQFDMEYIDMDSQESLRAANFELMPEDVIQKYHVLPLEKDETRLKVLIHDPMDLDLMDMLRFRMGCKIETVVASREKIKQFIDRFYNEGDLGDAEDSEEISLRSDDVDEQELMNARGDDAPIVRLVQKLIAEAVNSRASDIHIEPLETRVRVRYRIDGVCHERDNIPKRMQQPIITRLKIMSGMKIDERRVPQDGRIKLQIGSDRVDFRVSACPAYHGESMVLRILRPDSVKIGLVNLGFEADSLEKFDKIIRRPNGIFLVTGPTGSGKTTTLYSAIDVLNRPDRKIITAEDPVEYNFTGINQCQIREDIGFTFAKVLKAMLRQAPNIILVGEIRDKEVAEVAIQAALTGHLVFSTLHTNDAPSAITRLVDMGVKPFLVASSIQAIMAQRLIRILCKECKQPDLEPRPLYLKLCGIKPNEMEDKTIYKAVGCDNCGGTGYKGRQAIFEFMMMNSEIRELAFKRAPTTQVRAAAIATGMRTLAGDGKLKVLNGVTTPEEIARVAQVGELIEFDEDD